MAINTGFEDSTEPLGLIGLLGLRRFLGCIRILRSLRVLAWANMSDRGTLLAHAAWGSIHAK